jgi:hypothetical protein
VIRQRPDHLARLATVGLLLWAALPARAAGETEPQVTVAVDRPRPSVGDTVRLTYTFTGPGTGGNLRAPASLPLKNLTLVGGPSSSTRITFINGDLQRSLALTYYLRSNGVGSAEVGETTWILGDRTIKAAATVLEVSPPRQGVPGPGGNSDDEQQQPDDPFDAFFHPRRRVPNSQSAPPRRDAIIEFVATPDRTSAYVGEEIAIHYELVTQADIEGLEFVEPPKYPGCWAEDLEKVEKPVGRRDVYENRPVTRFTLLKKSVSGLAPGVITLPSAKVRLAVRTAGDPFSDPFSFIQRQVVERATKPISLKILAIPGRKDFKGPVGRFDVSARLDRARVSAGDAVTLKVRIAGTGNLRTATEPPQISIPNTRLYPPTRSGNEPASKPGKQGAFAEWDYVLVPSAGGALIIPRISMEVFDPAEKKIVTKSSAPLTLIVDRAAEPSPPAIGVSLSATTTTSAMPTSATTTSDFTTSPATVAVALPGTAVTELPGDPKAAHRPAPGFPTTGAPLATLDLPHGTITLPLWLLAAIPGALLLLGGTALVARRRLRKREQVERALKLEPEETKERASARMDRALREILEKRFGVPDGASAAQISETLTAAGQKPERVAEVTLLLEDLEFLRFAPQLGDYGDRIREAREKAARLFARLS